MSRPHVEFIQAQQLPWLAVKFAGDGWHGVEGKTLSVDPTTGACSMLLRLPRGFVRAAHSLEAQIEFMVLEGAQRMGDVDYGLDDYACLPAGYARDWRSEGGAILLAFFDGSPSWRGSEDLLAEWNRDQLIQRIDTHNTPWTRHDIDPTVQFLNLSHKILRHLPATGEKTILLSTGAQTHPKDWRERQLQHECVEEMYLLGGDIIGERGTMYEGAYFWRPPGEWHGPFGSRRGSLSLIRFAEGHHRNIWSNRYHPFELSPAYAPQLPPELASSKAALWQPPRF